MPVQWQAQKRCVLYNIANLKDRYDGIPDKAMVTIVKIDFTVQKNYHDVQLIRRLMTAKAFKDQFGEWFLQSIAMKIL